jgi:hypothetical protein
MHYAAQDVFKVFMGEPKTSPEHKTDGAHIFGDCLVGIEVGLRILQTFL